MFTVALLSFVAADGWQADPKLLAELERKKTPWLYRERDVPAYTLPDPTRGQTTARGWETHGRPETLDLFREHVYGRCPVPTPQTTARLLDEDKTAFGGKATRQRWQLTVTDGAKSFIFEAVVVAPNEGGKRPAFILINHRAEAGAAPPVNDFWPVELLLNRGYATATFRAGDVDADKPGDAARVGGVRAVWPGSWGTLAAWGWGASRVLDALQSHPAIDASRVAVIGHSRGGKAAWWAAAEDQRFALACSNDSGRGGASLARRRFGEPLDRITKSFPHWFVERYASYGGKEDTLPIDSHQLAALMAPRGVYAASADQDLWADPHGEFLSLAHASPVYGLYGEPGLKPDEMPALDMPLRRGRMGYHIRPGKHDLTVSDWTRYLDFFDALRPLAAR